MKLKPANKSKPAQTEIETLGDGRIILRHQQSIKLSQNYQSSEAMYGAEIVLNAGADKEKIDGAIAQMEGLIEEHLVAKVHQHKALLSNIG